MDKTSKKSLRPVLLQARRGLDPDVRAAANNSIRERLLGLPQIRQANTVFCFLSMDDEVDTHAIIRALQALDKQVLVPGIRDGRMQCYALDSWAGLSRGQLGILTPAMDTPWQGPVDTSITPGLGFSPAGQRLGFGRGYYDQWFTRHPGVYRIAVAYACQVLDSIPVDAHDVPMHLVVTETQTYIPA